jgi:hypothetical protein
MGVVVAHGAIELGDKRHGGNLLAGPHQARRDVGHFLAQRGRRRGLAVGAGQHGQFGKLVCQVAQAGDHGVQLRQEIGADRILQHQGVGYVVDVFRGAAEMDELADAHDFGIACQTVLQPVFHGLDVVIGAGLDGLDGFRIGDRETGA